MQAILVVRKFDEHDWQVDAKVRLRMHDGDERDFANECAESIACQIGRVRRMQVGQRGVFAVRLRYTSSTDYFGDQESWYIVMAARCLRMSRCTARQRVVK